MSLRTQIIDGDVHRSLRWGWWHVICLTNAAEAEGVDLWDAAEYVLTQDHSFTDPDDGEVLDLPAGTTIRLWRDR